MNPKTANSIEYLRLLTDLSRGEIAVAVLEEARKIHEERKKEEERAARRASSAEPVELTPNQKRKEREAAKARRLQERALASRKPPSAQRIYDWEKDVRPIPEWADEAARRCIARQIRAEIKGTPTSAADILTRHGRATGMKDLESAAAMIRKCEQANTPAPLYEGSVTVARDILDRAGMKGALDNKLLAEMAKKVRGKARQ